MAKGTDSKKKIFDALIEKYPNSFWEDENKILRIPFNEGGERVEIKITLTAAKNNLQENGGENVANFNSDSTKDSKGKIEFKVDVEPSKEELDNVKKMLEALDL